MLNVIGFRTLARSWNLPQPGSKRVYPPTQIIEQCIVSICFDINRFAHAEITHFILTFLQSRHIDYIISAKLTHRLQLAIAERVTWLSVEHGLGMGELNYEAQSWSAPRRIIVVRQHSSGLP
jgi:hypothetical protein